MYLWHETSLVASWILFFLYKVVLCADVLRCLFLAWCNFLMLLPFSMFVWDLQCWYLCCGLSSMSSRTCYTSWNMIAINYIVYSSLSIQIYWSVLTSTSKYTYNYVYCVVLLNYIFCVSLFLHLSPWSCPLCLFFPQRYFAGAHKGTGAWAPVRAGMRKVPKMVWIGPIGLGVSWRLAFEGFKRVGNSWQDDSGNLRI